MNNRERMRESNGKVRQWLVDHHFTEIHFFPHTMYSKDVYFLDMGFDGCCSYNKEFVLFQVKTNCKPLKREQSKMFCIFNETGVTPLWFDVVKRIGVVPYGLPKNI